MYCNKCGYKNEESSNFCSKCGKQIKDDVAETLSTRGKGKPIHQYSGFWIWLFFLGLMGYFAISAIIQNAQSNPTEAAVIGTVLFFGGLITILIIVFKIILPSSARYTGKLGKEMKKGFEEE